MAALIEQSKDGIVLDENGSVYAANKRFAEMLGYTEEELRRSHREWTAAFSASIAGNLRAKYIRPFSETPTAARTARLSTSNSVQRRALQRAKAGSACAGTSRHENGWSRSSGKANRNRELASSTASRTLQRTALPQSSEDGEQLRRPLRTAVVAPLFRPRRLQEVQRRLRSCRGR